MFEVLMLYQQIVRDERKKKNEGYSDIPFIYILQYNEDTKM